MGQPETGASPAKRGALDAFLDTIERVGNAVPHPAIIFLWLIALVIAVSAALAAFGVGVDYQRADPDTLEIATVRTDVRSLLSADGIRFMITSPVANFLGFGAVGVIIVAMIGVGLAERSGLIATLVKQIVKVAPKSIFTFIVVMLGVVSSIAADAGYLVLVPLGAAAFHSLGRHPLAGLAAAFSGVAGVFLVNVFVTPTDALLVEMTNDAIRLADPAGGVTLVGNLYFMIASSIVMGIICTILTEKFVEPHLGPYTGGAVLEGSPELTPEESRGLKYAGRALLGFILVVGLLTAPEGAVLRHPETGGIMSGSPFMSGLIVIISALFFTIGFAYGKGAGTVKTLTEAIGHVTASFAGLAGLIFLLLVIAQFIAFFNWTNIATVLAAELATLLEALPIGAAGYIVIFVVTVFVIDLLITGAVAKWAIFAPIFIPLFMRLGGDPDLVLAAYRVGDSPANVITPLNVYLGVMVGFAQKYVKDAGIGTIVALMLPYTLVMMVLWTGLLIAWNAFGLPLGPA
jgi:aminobenzoyl-glutamate transport protein